MGEVEKNFGEISKVIVDFVKTAAENLSDGFQMRDLAPLLPVLFEIEPAIRDADHALAYLKDMTPAKRQDIINDVVAKIGKEHPKAQEWAAAVIDFLASGYKIVTMMRSNTAPQE